MGKVRSGEAVDVEAIEAAPHSYARDRALKIAPPAHVLKMKFSQQTSVRSFCSPKQARSLWREGGSGHEGQRRRW